MGASTGARLSDCIAEYLVSCQSRGDRPNTLKSKRCTLDQLLLSTGNVLMRNVGPGHIDSLFSEFQSKGLRSSTVNQRRTILTHFFRWCQVRRYVSPLVSPMEGIRNLKSVPRERLRVPASKFGHLLDCAGHPRNRIVIALGLYLFLRQSEIVTLRVQDVSLDNGLVATTIHKTSQRDEMPICSELDGELRRWLTYYGETCGSLRGDWLLTPTLGRAKFKGTSAGFVRVDDGRTMYPMTRLKRLEHIAQDALEAAGYAIRGDDGSSNFEGIHTLRRSGARALYDQLVSRGHDGALREVQAMLHHASTQMTEKYLGITLDIKRRNDSIRGNLMFPSGSSGNVIPLDDRRANG